MRTNPGQECLHFSLLWNSWEMYAFNYSPCIYAYNFWTDWAFYPWYSYQSKRKKTPNSKLHLKIALCLCLLVAESSIKCTHLHTHTVVDEKFSWICCGKFRKDRSFKTWLETFRTLRSEKNIYSYFHSGRNLAFIEILSICSDAS